VLVPILVLFGTRDGISVPSLIEPWFGNILGEDKTLVKYVDWFHELLQEPKKEIVFSEILDWMKERCRGRVYGVNETRMVKDRPNSTQM
jgi:alpha-beta hydrolase superfamily lysophospholipase